MAPYGRQASLPGHLHSRPGSSEQTGEFSYDDVIMYSSESPVALGVHLAAGVAWLAVATAEGRLVPDRADRVALRDDELGDQRAVHEFEVSLEELIERLEPELVALLEAAPSQNPPSARSSRKRGWLEAGLMLAAHRKSSELVRVTHADVKNALGVRPSKQSDLHCVVRSSVDGEAPPRWDLRAPAFAAAIVAVRQRTGGA